MPGFFIWTSPLKSAYVGTTPVKEIYVGTTKVRPTEFTRTYTIAYTSGGTNRSPNLYVAWSKIKKIVAEWTYYSSTSWTDWNFCILRNANSGTTYWTDFYIRSWANVSYYRNTWSMNVYNGSSWTWQQFFPQNRWGWSWTINVKTEITETTFTIRLNGNQKVRTFSTAEANYIKSLFQTNCYMACRTANGSSNFSQATITVTYW